MSRALAGSVIAHGPVVEEFEGAIIERFGVDVYAVAVSSGTAALHLALLVAGVRPGDDVLMPSLTYVAPANAIRYVGGRPIFLDSEPDFRQLDVERAEAYVLRRYKRVGRRWLHRRTGRRLRAVIAIDLLGHPCDLDAILALAARLGIVTIDDAAEAFGARLRDRHVGAIAPLSALSFNANKIMTSAGGGMLVCHDPEHATRARLLASHAKRHGSALYLHDEVGFNYGMATAQAALGRSQLRRFDDFLERKRGVAERYGQTLSGIESVGLPKQAEWARATYWLYAIHVPAEHRTAVIDALEAQEIESRAIFVPMHQVVAHRRSPADRCPVAEDLSLTGLCLPCSTSITDTQIDEVAGTLKAVLERAEA